MRYHLIAESQPSCDYGIGCGVRVFVFDAVDEDAATKKAKQLVRDECGADAGLISLGLACNIKKLPLEKWEREWQAERERQDAEAQEAEERKQLAALQAKYNGKKGAP